ncbi:MAG TPA: S8 family serine peptidase [Mycobacteriales bacterium]
MTAPETQPATWRSWVLAVLAEEPDGRVGSEQAVLEGVAVRFADRFEPADRTYRGERPLWHGSVAAALARLRSDRLVRQSDARQEGDDPPVREQALTAAGKRLAAGLAPDAAAGTPADGATDRPADGAADGPADGPADGAADGPADGAADRPAGGAAGEDAAPGADASPGPGGSPVPGGEPPTLLTAGVIAPPLRSGAERARVGLPAAEDEPGPVMAELNLRYGGGPRAAFDRLTHLWVRVTGDPARAPNPLAEEYATGSLSMAEMKRLVSADAVAISWSRRALRRLWPDFPVKAQVDGSCVTVKADAARRAFNAYGDRVVWAVIDSGIWAGHPHFAEHATLTHESVRDLHRFFPDGEPDPDPARALVDETGHGTHVAGIIAGSIAAWREGAPGRTVQVTESRFNVESPNDPLRQPRSVDDWALLAGMAPKAKLVSLKVLQAGGTTSARVARVIRALEYVRKVNGESTDSMRIHGVNLSLGYEFDPQWFACGQSPLCREVDKLVRSGVVVVVAAGNSGYGSLAVKQDAPAKFGLPMTINDPGNARLAITVGSTHRDAPHRYGVSYFSSKGPTGDGRRKPDLVAPGERITSAAAGDNLTAVLAGSVPDSTAVYVEETGTSMAAPHVSGAIAALFSVRREFIGRPEEVKQVVLSSAVPLGRTPDFEGAGLLDLMRILQSI